MSGRAWVSAGICAVMLYAAVFGAIYLVVKP